MAITFNKYMMILAATAATAGVSDAGRVSPGTLLEGVRVVDAELMKRGPEMTAAYRLDLSGLRLGSNQRVTLTPWLVGETDSVALPSVVVNGRNAAIKYERDRSLQREGAQAIRISKDAETLWSGEAAVAYEPWMELCRLSLHEDVCGCGDPQGEATMPFGPEFDNRPAPEVVVTYLQPVVEATKARAEEGSAYVDYKVNQTNILPDYRNNRAEIRKITSTIDLVKNDPLVSITEINIHGYASPEGAYTANAKLAEGRAASLKNYVKSLYTLSDRLFTSSSTPEDWAGLKAMVEKSTLADKAGILEVIGSDLAPDAKDAALKSRFPQSYQVMLTEMYPALRHSDYTVKYVVRPLTIEETVEVMKVSPKNASLQEMFLVAQTYEPGSEEFDEAMSIAVRTYPSDPVANLNAGVTALRNGDLDGAERYLAKAGDTGEAQQARGLLALKRGDFDTAEVLLQAAKAAGVADADTNLSILARARQLALQNR